jgi:hypothetical protein
MAGFDEDGLFDVHFVSLADKIINPFFEDC